uniref:RCC1-like domain-containing protein n=1 Tax=Lotharella globosa TaxID=91324 RepID=A0A7S3YQC4_9EUKA
MGDNRMGKLGHSKPIGKVTFPKRRGSSTQPKIATVDSYGDFSVAISKNGIDLYAWGMGQQGSLGISSYTTQPLMFHLPEVDGINSRQKALQIAVGSEHCLVLTEDGNVFSWGSGKNGRLGHGNNVNCIEPQRLDNFVGGTGQQVIQLAAGEAHSMALDEKGQVYVWGSGSFGRLGLGGQGDRNVPTLVPTLTNVHCTFISCSSEHSLAVSRFVDGVSLFMWGGSKYGKLGLGKTGSQVSAPTPLYWPNEKQLQVIEAVCGPKVTICKAMAPFTATDKNQDARKVEIWAWGKAGYFFKDKTEDWITDIPLKTKCEYESVNVKSSNFAAGFSNLGQVEEEFKAKAVKVAAGERHALALGYRPDSKEQKKELFLLAWGENTHGQLGVGSVQISATPMRLPLKHNIVEIACGDLHSMALTEKCHLFTWGCNSKGQLGLNDLKKRKHPCLVQTLQGSNISKIAAGGQHSAAITGEGSLKFAAWGSNEFGQLGLELKNGENQLHPKILDSKVFCINGGSEELQPKKNDGFDICLGKYHTMVLIRVEREEEETYLFVCGKNDSSQLGIGQRSPSVNVLTRVSSWDDFPKADSSSTRSREIIPYITKLACGAKMSAAVIQKKELYMWGELPGISQKRYHKPQKILLHDYMPSQRKGEIVHSMHSYDFEDIDIGDDHVLAIVKITNRTQLLFSWGISSYGRLGVGNISKAQEDVGGEDNEETNEDSLDKRSESAKESHPRQVSEKKLEEKHPHIIDCFRECKQVACGSRQSFAVNPDSGHVYAWGHAARGKLGIGGNQVVVNEPVEIPVFHNLLREDAEDLAQDGNAIDTKHQPHEQKMLKLKKTQILQELSLKNFGKLELKIERLHKQYKGLFLNMISRFDDIEKGKRRAKVAIHARLLDQGMHRGGAPPGAIINQRQKPRGDYTQVESQGLGPLEQALGRMYLDPNLLFEIFKHTHTIFKQWRKEKEKKKNDQDAPETEPARGQAFEDLVFAIFDMNKDTDRRRFQIFFKLCVQYVLEPSKGGETKVVDLIREDMPLFRIFCRALTTGRSRAEIANIMCKLLSEKQLRQCALKGKIKELTIDKFVKSANMDEYDNELGDAVEDEKGKDIMRTRLGTFATHIVTLMVDGKYAPKLQKAANWLLDIIFMAIKERALQYEQSVKAYEQLHSGGQKTMSFMQLAQRRFCHAYVKVVCQVAIDTTHYRRLWNYNQGDVLELQDTEIFALHQLRGPEYLEGFFGIRQRFNWLPTGTTSAMIKEPEYKTSNNLPYSEVDSKLGEDVFLTKLLETNIDNGDFETRLMKANHFFHDSKIGAAVRYNMLLRQLHRDLLEIRSKIEIRNVHLSGDVQSLLVEMCNVPQRLREIWSRSNLPVNMFRIIPFYIERERPIIFDHRTENWVPAKLDDILNDNAIPEKTFPSGRWAPRGFNEFLVDGNDAKRKKSALTTRKDAHRISVEDCIVMYKVLKEEKCIKIMRTKTGEGAWKGLINLLRTQTERKKNVPHLKEQYEKTKNSLLIIKDADSNTSVVLGDEQTAPVRSNMLDPSLLFIRLKSIFENQKKKMKQLEENLQIYEETVKGLKVSSKKFSTDVLELAQVYLNITGPHETDNTQLLKELEDKRDWSKTAKQKQRNDRSLKYHQNIPYVPRKITPDCHLGGMKWRTYNQLVNKDGIHDCTAWWTCYTWFYSGADAVLPRTNHDPTDNCCFCLCCPSFVLRISLRAKMALFLKSASFIFIPTSRPHVFNMKLAVANSNGKQEILLHTKISLSELKQHIENCKNNVGEKKIIDKQVRVDCAIVGDFPNVLIVLL